MKALPPVRLPPPVVWPIPPRPELIRALKKGAKLNPVLRPFQQEGVAFLRRHNYTALIADAPGAGKTPQALSALREAPHQLTPALVTCPSSVAWNWRREARLWAPEITCHVIEGISDPLPEGPVGLIVCPWDLLAPRQDELLARGLRTIIADEAHYAKNPESQRGEATAALCKQAEHVILLSGTPLINTADELHTLYRLLGTERPPMLRRLLEDVAPDIPEKKRVRLDVAISKEAMKEYRKAETEFQEYLDAMLVAQGADAEDGKAPKMLSAAALVKVGYLRRILGRAKVPSAAAWIVRQIQAGEPPVVFAEHQDVIEALCTTLDKAKVSYVRLDGTVGRKARQQAIDRFQDGDVSVFIGSQAAREGITLTRARHALFIERWWTPAAEEQAEDRIRRIGQKYPTFVWFMSVPGTYDDRMSEIIESKRILVKRAIGSHDVQRLDATELLGEWLRGQPDADLSMPSFPTLPHGAKVHALVFDARNWTADTVRRWCRMHDYAPLSVEASDTKIRVVIRQKVEYVPGSFRGIDLGPDFGAILGTPRAVRKVTRNRNKAPRIVRI